MGNNPASFHAAASGSSSWFRFVGGALGKQRGLTVLGEGGQADRGVRAHGVIQDLRGWLTGYRLLAGIPTCLRRRSWGIVDSRIWTVGRCHRGLIRCRLAVG